MIDKRKHYNPNSIDEIVPQSHYYTGGGDVLIQLTKTMTLHRTPVTSSTRADVTTMKQLSGENNVETGRHSVPINWNTSKRRSNAHTIRMFTLEKSWLVKRVSLRHEYRYIPQRYSVSKNTIQVYH